MNEKINTNSIEYRFKDNLPKAFIPTNLYVRSNKTIEIRDKSGALIKHESIPDKMVKVKYVDIRGYWPDGSIGIDQYYDSNHAVFQRTTKDQLEQIDGYENAIDFDEKFKLFENAFNQ